MDSAPGREGTRNNWTNDRDPEASSANSTTALNGGPPAKRLRTSETPNQLSPLFFRTQLDTVTNVVVDDLVKRFTDRCPGVSRASLDSLPNNVVVNDSFLVLQATSSRGQCAFMQQTRWRLLCREILPDGMRGACNFLVIPDYLPALIDGMPLEFKTQTEWPDLKTAPVIVLAGFKKEIDKFINPNWNANLICGTDCVTRLAIGTVAKKLLFVSDFEQARQSTGSNLPTSGRYLSTSAPSVRPFAAMLDAQQPHTEVSADSLHLNPVVFRKLAFSRGYTPIGDTVPGRRYCVIAVVKHFFAPKPVNQGRSLMQLIGIVDPTMNIAQDDRLLCMLFGKSFDKLPPISKTGDIVVLKNIQILVHNDAKQGKGYEDSMRFAVVKTNEFVAVPGSNTPVTPADEPVIGFLRKWYEEFAETVVADSEAKWRQESERKAAEKERLARLSAPLPQQESGSVPLFSSYQTAPSLTESPLVGEPPSVDATAVPSLMLYDRRKANELDLAAVQLSGEIFPPVSAVSPLPPPRNLITAAVQSVPVAQYPQQTARPQASHFTHVTADTASRSTSVERIQPAVNNQPKPPTKTPGMLDSLFCRTV